MKKRIRLFLTFAIVLSLLACGSCANADAADEAVTLDSVAMLNSCEVSDLNAVYDDDGHLTFLAGRLADTRISDEEEAETFIRTELASLLDLGDIRIGYYSTYASPNTGVTYYRFQQSLAGDIAGAEDITLKYFYNSVKLGVDKDGYPVVLSSDLCYDTVSADGIDLISVDEAAEILENEYPGVSLYMDSANLGYWQDAQAKSAGSSDTVLAYMIYADNMEADETNGYSPYITYVVRAENTGDEMVVATLAADSLDEYDTSVENPSLRFFDGMEDAGTKTYTVNFGWMSESDLSYSEAFAGGDTLEITVPVMYNPSDGLYYLGEAEHYITMSNFWDFVNASGNVEKLNPYVTEDPDDLNAWHFRNAGDDAYGITYLDDPNYVLASFESYYKVVENFGSTYNMFQDFPYESYILCTYTVQGMYPDGGTNSDFMFNACNGGKWYNWTTFLTSPATAYCMDLVTMCHEFTHSITSHFTDGHYANEQGAVIESSADMVAYPMAVGMDERISDWIIGGTYCAPVRTFSAPTLIGQAQYKDGLYYIPSLSAAFMSDPYLDNGGVHTNSGVGNFLGYSLVEGETGEGEEALTFEDGLNVWFETLYVGNYDTDYTDLGAYLKYVGSALGLSEAKLSFMERNLKELGFEGNPVDASLLAAEDGKTFTVTYDYEDGLDRDYALTSGLLDRATLAVYVIGEADGTVQTTRIPNGGNYPCLYLVAADADGNLYSGFCLFNEALGDSLTLHIKQMTITDGDLVTFGDDESVASMAISGIAAATDDAGNSGIAIESGVLAILYTTEAGYAPGEYNAYIVTVNP